MKSRLKSRNWIRFLVIQNHQTYVTIEHIRNKVITEVEYKLLCDINSLRDRLESARIQFLSGYRQHCEYLDLPKPPDRKPVTEDIIDGIKTHPF